MANPSHAHHAAERDIVPPGAAYAASHHGHTIVPLRILVGVLAALMVFTLLTVFAAKAEEWFAGTFNVVIPQWINVFVALSIATVKSVLVFAYFMQLRYDNPTNTVVLFFTLIVLTFFLGFTMLDLGNRGILYEYKGRHITDGGIYDNAKPKAIIAREQSLARVQRWVRLSGDPKQARLDLVNAVSEQLRAVEGVAASAQDQPYVNLREQIAPSIRSVQDALKPFSEGEVSDRDVRALQIAIHEAADRMNSDAPALVAALGPFEQKSLDAVEDYRIRTHPLEHRDLQFVADEIARLRAAGTPLEDWLAAFEHDHLAHHADELHGHDAHAKPWNDEGAGNSAERSRPRTGITLPELGGKGDGHGAPAHAPSPGEQHPDNDEQKAKREHGTVP